MSTICLSPSALAAAQKRAQDAAVTVLASRLAGDGFHRTNPFKAFGVLAPAKLINLNVMKEATTLIALAPRIAAHPKVGAESKRAAAKMYEAALAARTASNEREVALQKRGDAVEARDGSLPKQLRVALAELKTTIRYVDLLEGTTHYVSVFRGSTRSRASKKPQAVEEPVS